MELVYTDVNHVDNGFLDDYNADFSIGGTNDFELSGCSSELEIGCYVYEQGTECGGIVRDMSSDTSNGAVTYIGDTWRGLMAQKIVEPAQNEDYFSVNGNIITVMNQLITKCSLSELFVCDAASSLTVSYRFKRYESLLDGLTTMLSLYGYCLELSFDGSKVHMIPKLIQDLSEDIEISQDSNYTYKIEKRTPINHLIALGQGELKDRTVVHLYLQEDGTIGSSQFYFGNDEIEEVYDNTNAESEEELTKEAIAHFKEQLDGANSLELTVSGDIGANLGDIVGGRDYDTGILIKSQITEIIINVSDGVVTRSYTVGSASTASSQRNTTTSSEQVVVISGGGSEITVDAELSTTSTNPVQNKVLTSRINQVEGSIPDKVSQLTNDSGFTSNVGTITGVKMNGSSKGTSGVVDLGTVITSNPQMVGATADIDGSSGLVPQAAAGQQGLYLKGNGTWGTPTNTKNTAGSTNSTSKLFLIGATSQAANPQTYSNSAVYAQNGALHASQYYLKSGSYLLNEGGQSFQLVMPETSYGFEFGVINKAWAFAPLIYSSSIKEYLGVSSRPWKSGAVETAFTVTSDRNKKRDIKELDDKYLELFRKLIPVSYMLISGDRTHVGFISQDVEKAMEECGLTNLDFAGFCKDVKVVTIENEDGTTSEEICYDENGNPMYEYSLRYEEFIALNTMAIQRISDRVSILESKIDLLMKGESI